MPLHVACMIIASLDVVKILVDAHPEETQLQEKDGCLPLHLACKPDVSPDVMKLLLEAYPEATRVRTDARRFVIHVSPNG